MDNKKVGRFIREQRTNCGMTQKELAEKLNCTDKAVSRWETGNGAPDISNLIPLAKELNTSVVEILNGHKIENVNEADDAVINKISEIESKGNRKFKILISILVVIALIVSSVYIGYFAYWGRRHMVLYDIDTIYLTQTDDGVRYHFDVEAKNRLINPFNTYCYNLHVYYGGEHIYDVKGGTEQAIVITRLKNTMFRISGVIFVDDVETAKSFMSYLSFVTDYDEMSALNLYMEDFKDVKFVIESQ